MKTRTQKTPTTKKSPRKAPATPVEVPARIGRPAEGTARGSSKIRFDVPDDFAKKLRDMHAIDLAGSGIQFGPWCARKLAVGCGISPPSTPIRTE